MLAGTELSVGLPVADEDDDVADVVLGWPYRPQAVLPQRWDG